MPGGSGKTAEQVTPSSAVAAGRPSPEEGRGVLGWRRRRGRMLVGEMRVAETCYYCGLEHSEVEAGGIWFCPNFMCTGPGGCSHRAKLASYRQQYRPKTCHTVDEEEWAAAGFLYADMLENTDPALAARIRQDAAAFPEIVERRRKKKQVPT